MALKNRISRAQSAPIRLRVYAVFIILKSAVERGSFDQTMDEMDIVDPVDFTRKGIDFLVHFVHKVHDVHSLTTHNAPIWKGGIL